LRNGEEVSVSASSRFASLFRNAGFILALAFIVGLVLPHGAAETSPAVVPLLALVMTMSIMGVSPRLFLDFRKVSRPILLSLLMNCVVLTLALIGLSFLIIRDYELRTGFILLAAVPPAVAVIPFTYRLGGNTDFSLVGTVACYLAALFIVPIISAVFWGTSVIQPVSLLITLGELIALPLAIAQLLRRTGIASKLERYRGTIVNWGFFVVVYTIVGLNQSAFLEQPERLLPTAAAAFISTFVLAYIIDRVSRFSGVNRASRISLILSGTRKNYGMAAAIALALFSPRAAAAVAMVFAIVHFIWLTFWVRRMR
jgi:BASS family bile acid:Na+ symporter